MFYHRPSTKIEEEGGEGILNSYHNSKRKEGREYQQYQLLFGIILTTNDFTVVLRPPFTLPATSLMVYFV